MDGQQLKGGKSDKRCIKSSGCLINEMEESEDHVVKRSSSLVKGSYFNNIYIYDNKIFANTG